MKYQVKVVDKSTNEIICEIEEEEMFNAFVYIGTFLQKDLQKKLTSYSYQISLLP